VVGAPLVLPYGNPNAAQQVTDYVSEREFNRNISMLMNAF